MKKLFLVLVGGLVSAMALPAFACGGGGGCGMGGMGGGRGYYGGGRSVASSKVLSGGPRVARYGSPAGRTLANAAKPATARAARPATTVANASMKTKTSPAR